MKNVKKIFLCVITLGIYALYKAGEEMYGGCTSYSRRGRKDVE